MGLRSVEKRMLRGKRQPRLLLLERFGHGQIVTTGEAPLMPDMIAPLPGLALALGQSGERAAGPEGVARIANRSFHPPFGRSARTCQGRAAK